jgi:hypothetical protein
MDAPAVREQRGRIGEAGCRRDEQVRRPRNGAERGRGRAPGAVVGRAQHVARRDARREQHLAAALLAVRRKEQRAAARFDKQRERPVVGRRRRIVRDGQNAEADSLSREQRRAGPRDADRHAVRARRRNERGWRRGTDPERFDRHAREEIRERVPVVRVRVRADAGVEARDAQGAQRGEDGAAPRVRARARSCIDEDAPPARRAYTERLAVPDVEEHRLGGRRRTRRRCSEHRPGRCARHDGTAGERPAARDAQPDPPQHARRGRGRRHEPWTPVERCQGAEHRAQGAQRDDDDGTRAG